MTAKIYRFPKPEDPEVLTDGPEPGDGDGEGPDVIEIRIILEGPDLSEEPEVIKEPEPKSSSWKPFLWGALAGWLIGG